MGSNFVQYMAMISGSFLPMTSGINLGWTSPYLPVLEDPNQTKNPMTPTEASWCAVMPLVGAPLGALIAALMVDRYGRKSTILVQGPVIAMCFLSLAFYQDFLMVSIARFIIGSCEGALYTVLPIYYGEIASPKIRGVLGSSIAVAALIGMLFINAIGAYLSIFTSSVICACVPLMNFLTFVCIPESPYYLLKKGDGEGAKRSLARFRGTEDVGVEFTEISAAVKRQEACNRSSILDLVTVKSNRRAIIIYCILSFSNKFSGNNPIIFYTTSIFTKAGGTLDPVTSVLLYNVAGVVATLFALIVIDRFGRRPLMLFSALGCALALSGEAAYFTVQKFAPESLPSMGWLPVTALLIYNVIFSFGLSFGPVLFLSELFPTSVKAYALGVADTISIILGTMASKLFHALTTSLGMYVPFWVFTGCTLLGFYLIFTMVPETKGKTLEDIQLELIGNNSENSVVEKNKKSQS